MHPKSDIAGFPALFVDSVCLENAPPAPRKKWLVLAVLAVPVVCVLTLVQ